jgi:mannose-1-phosphate guanylyltransferase
MLRHTLTRAERLLSPERLLTVVSRQHLGYAREELYDRPPDTVIVQPCNRGTGPGILLPLLHICQRDPDAIVTLLPSDHFIVEEERFMAAVEDTASFVASSSRHLVLLGVDPDRPETEYGWIEVGERLGYEREQQLYQVKSFWEKPRPKTAKALYQSGCLWNTLVLTGRVWMLLLLFQTLTPRLYLRFQQARPVLGARGEAKALQDLYRRLHSVNFSQAILTRSVGALSVLRTEGIYWSDWGNPEQVSKDVARFAPAGQHETRLSSSPRLVIPD